MACLCISDGCQERVSGLFNNQSEMSHKQRFSLFRKEIRREHIDQIFMIKRIQMLSSYEEEDTSSYSLEGDIFDLSTLLKLKRMATRVEGVEQLDKAGYIEKLTPLLDEQYANTPKQCHASHIIGNIYYAPHHSAPPHNLVSNIMTILEGEDLETIENCLNLLSNLMFDNPQWRSQALLNLDLGARLNKLFDRQNTSQQFVQQLLRTIFILLQNLEKHKSVKLIRKNLMGILGMETAPNIFMNCLYAFYNTILPYQKEDAPQVLGRSQLIPKFVKFMRQIQDGKGITMCLQMLTIGVSHMSQREVIYEIIPFLLFLHSKQYQFPKVSAEKVEKLVYRFIFNALETGILKANSIPKEWFEVMLEAYQTSENKNVLRELTFIFCLIHTNCDQEHMQSMIEPLIDRAERILPDNIELIGFIRENKTALGRV